MKSITLKVRGQPTGITWPSIERSYNARVKQAVANLKWENIADSIWGLIWSQVWVPERF